MSKFREDLHKLLLNAMNQAWLKIPSKTRAVTPNFTYNVYFQAPSSIKYPAIVYERYSGVSEFADNKSYLWNKQYTITVMDTNPDSTIPDEIAKLPMCTYDRHYVYDHVHHDVFRITF